MNALVASSISQMRAYADLVNTLEKGLAAYKAQVQNKDVIIKWIETRIPETGTDPAKLKTPSDNIKQEAANLIIDLYQTKLVSILGAPASAKGYAPPGSKADWADTLVDTQLTAAQVGDPSIAKPLDATSIPQPDTTTSLIPISLTSAVVTSMTDDAANNYDILDKLVQRGMLRIVVTDGHILTKMTFEMKTSDSDERTSADVYGSSFAVRASAGASWGWGRASASASYSRFNVHVANERSQTSTDILTTMMGEVLVNYKSDFYPALPSQAKP
jgi:hypothetical protein